MQCEEFDRRFHELLDCRQAPEGDGQLLEHASDCEACGRTLQDWLRIDGVFGAAELAGAPAPLAEPDPSAWRLMVESKREWGLAAALAACLLGGVWLAGGNVERESRGVAETGTAAAPLDFQQIGSRVAQPEWWGSVVRAAWEPVDPLAEGFRPLTNSLQTALELLTPRAGSPPQDVPSPLPEDANVGLAAAPPRLV